MEVKRRDPVILKEFPEHLKGIPYREFIDGQIRVYKNGKIFRKNKRGIVEAPQHGTGMNQRYLIVSAMKNGRQKHLYVHRLLAKAFIPNPDNKPHINHIDGNPRNNDLDNLEWVTPKENVDHAIKIGLATTLDNTPHECPRCSGPTMKAEKTCSECNKEMQRIKRILATKQKQRNRYRDIDTTKLKPLYKRIIKSRFQGLTLEEIGQEMGVTREYVRQLEEKVMDKDPVVLIPAVLSSKPFIEEDEEDLTDFKLTFTASRVNAGLTLVDVAEKTNKTPQTIRNWESGKTKIPANKFKFLVDLYGVPVMLLNFKRKGNWVVLKEETE